MGDHLSDKETKRIFERRIGFPIFQLLFFVFASGVFPFLVMKYATRTVPGAQTSWVLVSLLTGGLFLYGLVQWQKVIRLEIDAEGVTFNTLADRAPRRIPFREVAAFEYHPAARANDALVIVLKKNAGESFWKSSDNPVLTEPYGIRMRDLQREVQAALVAFCARNA